MAREVENPDRPAVELDERMRLRVAVVGMSTRSTCGVHDHATLLADALTQRGASISTHWLWREERSLPGSRREVARWKAGLVAELRDIRPDLVLLHYSVFSYSHRGIPVFVRPVLSALPPGVPIVAVLHEFVYPWTRGGWRGKAWAVSQRAVLIAVMRAISAALVTVDENVAWLRSRPWLPKRRVAFAPVFSNLPRPGPATGPDDQTSVVGIFGYAYPAAAVGLVLDALMELARKRLRFELRLLGAPGRSSAAGETWRAEARERGLEGTLSFSGRLPAQQLSDALARCNLLLFPDPGGPSSRKGTLAAVLASGRPVVAIDGPRCWSAPVRAGAIEVVKPTSDALAGAVGRMLGDEMAQNALGSHGRRFYQAEMDVARTADAVIELVAGAVGPGPRGL